MRLTAVIVVAAALALKGCGMSHNTQQITNPQVKQSLAKSEEIVKGCLSKGNVASRSGRKAILTCIAPASKTKALEQCATKAAIHDLPFHRARLVGDLAACVEAVR